MSGEKNRGGRTGGPSTPHAERGKGKNEQDTPSGVQRMMTSLGLTFKGVEDPRASRGKRHPLAAMLMLLVQAGDAAKEIVVQSREPRGARTCCAKARHPRG